MAASGRTNELRLLMTVRLITYKFECMDCGKRWLIPMTEDKGESFARAQVRHRCSKKFAERKEFS